MPFGQKQGSLTALKKSLAKGGGGGAWIKYVPKNGSLEVRFIQEPEEWVNYFEHFDPQARKSFPCNGEATCPGCLADVRRTARYLANALDLTNRTEGAEPRVIALQLPKDLANRLVIKYEKWGSLTDRNIELSRQGEQLDTVYDFEPDAVDNKRVDKYIPLDLLKVLEDAYESVFGDEASQNGSQPAPRPRPRPRSREDGPDKEDDQDQFSPGVLQKSKKDKKAKKEADEPKDPEFHTTDVDLDQDEWDEATLSTLPMGVLRRVARDFGVDPKGKDQPAIIAEIMSTGDPVAVADDDDPGF